MRIMKDPNIRKKEFIHVSLELFKEKGIEKTPVDDIVKKVGVAKGLFYYYFKSKNEVVKAVIDLLVLQIDNDAYKIIDDVHKDFYEKLTDFIDLYFSMLNCFSENLLAELRLESNKIIYNYLIDSLSEINKSHFNKLMKIGVNNGIIKIQYPQDMLTMIVCGIRELVSKKDISRSELLTLVEQGLNLECGRLTRKLK